MPSVLTETGLLDISSAEYFAMKALSVSGMKDLMVSPMRCWHLHINPNAPEIEETAAMRLGRALHCAVLEGEEKFDQRFACALDPSQWLQCLDTMQDLREWIISKGGKPKGTKKEEVAYQAACMMEELGEQVPILLFEERRFSVRNEGKTILTAEEFRRVNGMASALLSEPIVFQALKEGRPEQAIMVRDPETGVLLKSRIDWMNPVATWDLKSFMQTRGKSIDRTITDALFYEGYLEQAYFYRMVRKLASKETGLPFVFAFVESEAPYEVRVKKLEPNSGQGANVYWETAGATVRKYIRLYAKCLAKYGDSPWRDEQDAVELVDEDIPQLAWSQR